MVSLGEHFLWGIELVVLLNGKYTPYICKYLKDTHERFHIYVPGSYLLLICLLCLHL